jgi:hypothetical protein
LIAQEHDALERLGAPLTEEDAHFPVWTPPRQGLYAP